MLKVNNNKPRLASVRMCPILTKTYENLIWPLSHDILFYKHQQKIKEPSTNLYSPQEKTNKLKVYDKNTKQ